MRARPEAGKLQPKVSLDISALIDVVFLLLLFFMVSTTFLEQSGLRIDLPGSSETVPHQEEQIPEVSVNKEGQLFYDGEPATMAEIEEKLRLWIAEGGSPGTVIKADQEVNYGLVVTLMDLIRRSGVQDLVVATKPLPVD